MPNFRAVSTAAVASAALFLVLFPSLAVARPKLRLRHVEAASGLIGNDIKSVYFDSGRWFVATSDGVYLSQNEGQTFSRVGTGAQGLNGALPKDVFATAPHVFVATDRGLAVSSDTGATFSFKTTANGLGTDTVDVVGGNGPVVYAGTAQGLAVSSDFGEHFVNRTTAHGLGSNEIIALSIHGDYDYVGTRGGGYAFTKDQGKTFVSSLDAGPTITGLAHDGIYCGTNEGLKMQQWIGQETKYVTLPELGTRPVTALREYFDYERSILYVGFEDGMAIQERTNYGNPTTAFYGAAEGLMGRVAKVAFSDKTLFVATDRGLYVARLGWTSSVYARATAQSHAVAEKEARRKCLLQVPPLEAQCRKEGGVFTPSSCNYISHFGSNPIIVGSDAWGTVACDFP